MIVSDSSPSGVGSGVPIEGEVDRARPHQVDEHDRRCPRPARSRCRDGRGGTPASASNSGVIVQPVTMPTTRRPRTSPFTSSTALRTASADGQRGAGGPERRGAGRRQRRGPLGAVEQRGAEVALELADLRADPGLADVHPPAARVKFASSATATKYSSCRSSMTRDSSHQHERSLGLLTGARPRSMRRPNQLPDQEEPDHDRSTTRRPCSPKT